MMRIALLLVALASSSASADTYWLWAIDGRYEASKKPCVSPAAKSNPAQLAIIDFIGSETYVDITDGELDLLRGEKRVRSKPDRRATTTDGNVVSIWYQGMRTWIVTAIPKDSPAFTTITLVMESNTKREGAPKCYERWIAPVSP